MYYLTDIDSVKLTVAHVTGDDIQIIQPLKVTSTHVVIDIQHFFLFGLLRELLFRRSVRAQLLLFYQQRFNKLNIHLLPGNVEVEKVICFYHLLCVTIYVSLLYS